MVYTRLREMQTQVWEELSWSPSPGGGPWQWARLPRPILRSLVTCS